MLIGFNGAMGSGKSEASNQLIELGYKTGTPAVNVKFAQPLYDMQEYIYNRISSVVKRDASFVKDRKLLQWLGTEWGRDSISKTLWIDIWRAKVQTNLEFGAIVLCDDVRFENEAAAFREMGGTLIHIRTTRNAERINTVSGIANHASEHPLDLSYFNHVIDNNGTLEEYRVALRRLFATIGVYTPGADESLSNST